MAVSTVPLVYSPGQLANLLGLHPETVRRWLASGNIPGRKVGGLWLVSAVRLRAWLESRESEDDAPGLGRPAIGPEDPRPARRAPRPAARPPRRQPARSQRPAVRDDRWIVPPIVGHG